MHYTNILHIINKTRYVCVCVVFIVCIFEKCKQVSKGSALRGKYGSSFLIGGKVCRKVCNKKAAAICYKQKVWGLTQMQTKKSVLCCISHTFSSGMHFLRSCTCACVCAFMHMFLICGLLPGPFSCGKSFSAILSGNVKIVRVVWTDFFSWNQGKSALSPSRRK